VHPTCLLTNPPPVIGGPALALSRTAELMDHWGGDHGGLPIFVVSRRLFDVLPSLIELEIVHVVDTPEATHIRYRVRR
jgi:hypothetical protein